MPDPKKGNTDESPRTDHDREMEQPSVIVEMSPAEKYMPALYTKHVKIGLIIVAALLVLALASIWYIDSLSQQAPVAKRTKAEPEEKLPSQIEIAIIAQPKDTIISIDGNDIGQSIAQITVKADDKMHTVTVRKEGYETMERDIRFNHSQTVKLKLQPIVIREDTASTQAGEITEIITD